MLSSTLPIALDGTLPACLTVCSQVSSQDTPKNTSEYAPKYTSESLASTLSSGKTLSISLDYMLPCMLLHARSRGLLSCRRQALRGVRLVAYGEHSFVGGGLRVACGVWHVAGARWQAAYVGRYHDVGRYGSLNLIFCAATRTRSHDASRSWC